MLQFSRFMQCAMIASSSFSLFASTRGISSGRRAVKKTLTSSPSSGKIGRGRGNMDVEEVSSRADETAMSLDFDVETERMTLPPTSQRAAQFLHGRNTNNNNNNNNNSNNNDNNRQPLSSSLLSSRGGRRAGSVKEEEMTTATTTREKALVGFGVRAEGGQMSKDVTSPNGHHNNDYDDDNNNNYYNGGEQQRRPLRQQLKSGVVEDTNTTRKNNVTERNTVINTTMSTNDFNNNDNSGFTGLTNPFLGLHDHITRSYRLDQLLAVARPEDVLLGRQETKSGAFSFIRFECGPRFLEANLKSTTTTTAAKGTAGQNKDTASHNDCALIVAERLLSFPQHLQHFHSICGRENVPCDFFADVDLPNETVASGEKILQEMLNYLEVRLQGIGFHQPSFLILTNEVSSEDKVSFHVHARSMGALDDPAGTGGEEEHDEGDVDRHDEDDNNDDEGLLTLKGAQKKKKRSKKLSTSSGKKKQQKKMIAFQDYRVVKLLADEVNTTLGRTVIDDQCYRTNGMLRCAFSSKIAPSPSGGVVRQKGKRLVPLLKAKDPALQRRLNDMSAYWSTLSDAEILERSFGTRFVPVVKNQKAETIKDPSHYFKLLRPRHILGPKEAHAVEFDAYGNAVSVYLTEAAKWRRFKSVIAKLRRMPPSSAESYDVWVRVGLALHNFSNEDHVFEEWVRFSLKCPQKYSRESCRKKWQQFERNPDALNWRRGFNYLNSTVWRSVHGGFN